MTTASATESEGSQIVYVAPMAAFMLLTAAGSQWPSLYPASYVAKTVVVAAMLAVFWRRYARVRWNHWWLGALVGVVGFVEWVGLELLIGNYPRLGSATPYPYDELEGWRFGAFVAVRWVGAALVVPVMEELFWRDFLWRTIAAPDHFTRVPIGVRSAKAILVVTAVFATVHVQWIPAIVWGLTIAGLLVYTRSLGACIVAHAVTNLLLGAYVLATRQWVFW